MNFHLSSCAHHPLRNAAGIGPRCGDFLCRDCLLEDEEKCCSHCQIRVRQVKNRRVENAVMLVVFNLFCGALILKMRSVTAVILIVAIPVIIMIIYMRNSPAPTGPKPGSKKEEERDGESETGGEQQDQNDVIEPTETSENARQADPMKPNL